MKYKIPGAGAPTALMVLALSHLACGSNEDDAVVPPFVPSDETTAEPEPLAVPPEDGEAAAPDGEGTESTAPSSSEGSPGDIAIADGQPDAPGSMPDPDEMQEPVDVPGAPSGGDGFAIVENLDRGVVAVVQGGGVYVGWRMLGYEYDRESPERVSYNLYRDGALLRNVATSTNFFDPQGVASSSYGVAVVIDGIEGPASAPVAPWAQNFQFPGRRYGRRLH